MFPPNQEDFKKSIQMRIQRVFIDLSSSFFSSTMQMYLIHVLLDERVGFIY